jgi:hypothetical protein
VLRFLLFGMFYATWIQGVGNGYIDASWYEAANIPRFVLHVCVLPFLTIFALATMRAAGVGVAQTLPLTVFCWIFTAAALAWGFYHEVMQLQLAPKPALGVMKLGSVSSLPPIATIATNILILPMAAAIWKVSGWKWFFLGGAFILVLNGATGAQPWGFLVGNFAELIFMLCLLATQRRFSSWP